MFEAGTLRQLAVRLVEDRREVRLVKYPESAAREPPAIPAVSPGRSREWTVPRESELDGAPETRAVVTRLLEKHCWEASAVARRDIAPWLFLSSSRRGFFYFSQIDDLVFAFCYLGPEDAFEELADELVTYCAERELLPHILSEVPLRTAGGQAFGAVPFGAMQRLPELAQFTLKGRAMGRLRYLVKRFGRDETARTEESCSGSDAATDQAIVRVLDAWCAGKNMVNPYIRSVRRELAGGRLPAAHRAFLTWQATVWKTLSSSPPCPAGEAI